MKSWQRHFLLQGHQAGYRWAEQADISKKHDLNLKVKVIIPNYRKENLSAADRLLLEVYSDYIQYVVSMSHDDNFIIDLAMKSSGLILTNDNFKEFNDKTHRNYNPAYYDYAEFRHLRYAFVDDFFSINDHPSGNTGPTLNELLGVC